MVSSKNSLECCTFASEVRSYFPRRSWKDQEASKFELLSTTSLSRRWFILPDLLVWHYSAHYRTAVTVPDDVCGYSWLAVRRNIIYWVRPLDFKLDR
jgi:hypothetical protein